MRSILVITHLIEEAVYLSDRIVVLSANPGQVREVVTNPLPHPRAYRDPAFLRLVDEIHAVITNIHLPDEAAAPAVAASAPPTRIVPLPPVHISEVVGLLEIAHHRGDRVNLFDLADDLRLEFGRVILVTKSAEMLELVDTPRQEVVLTALGRDFVLGDVNTRKRTVHRQLRSVGVFAYLLRLLDRAPAHRLPADVVIEQLVLALPTEEPTALFDTVVGWGRYGELLGYDPDAQILYLDEGTGGRGSGIGDQGLGIGDRERS